MLKFLVRTDDSNQSKGIIDFKVLPRIGEYVSLEGVAYDVIAIVHGPKIGDRDGDIILKLNKDIDPDKNGVFFNSAA